jgi:choline monooxygenase
VTESALLPATWYSDEEILGIEKRTLFARGPRYVGHELSVPAVGDRRPVDLDGEGLILARGTTGIEVLVNACRHRQAAMVTEPGNSRTIQCPFHRWTYAMDGKILAAPHFPQKPCRNLFSVPFSSWNGLILAGPAPVARDLAEWGDGELFSFEGHKFHKTVDMECRQNWKTFVEVYLDLYHVAPFHPGLSGFITCDDLRWDSGEFFTVQTVGLQKDLSRAKSPAYGRWQDKVLEAFRGRMPDKGAVWAFYYPNFMLEWNPGALMVSVLRPVSPSSTMNRVDFFYDEEVVGRVPGFIEAHQEAYFETAAEDEKLGRMMDEGRRTLAASGREDAGPVQSPMEDGIVLFHKYVLESVQSP